MSANLEFSHLYYGLLGLDGFVVERPEVVRSLDAETLPRLVDVLERL
jgi:hypothetical protein